MFNDGWRAFVELRAIFDWLGTLARTSPTVETVRDGLARLGVQTSVFSGVDMSDACAVLLSSFGEDDEADNA